MKAKPPTGSWKSGPTAICAFPSSAFLGLTAKDCQGQAFSFNCLAQKVTVVINVAEPKSAIQNMTPQSITSFKELATLHDQYHEHGLQILAFPCDQFSANASGSTHESRDGRAWCHKMGIEFEVMQKVEVNGEEEHPVYRLLKQEGHDIRGNFQTSFLVAVNGDHCKVLRFDGLPPRALRSRIEDLLSEVTPLDP